MLILSLKTMHVCKHIYIHKYIFLCTKIISQLLAYTFSLEVFFTDFLYSVEEIIETFKEISSVTLSSNFKPNYEALDSSARTFTSYYTMQQKSERNVNVLTSHLLFSLTVLKNICVLLS